MRIKNDILRSRLKKFAKCFYDKIYADPWIGKFFQDIDQEIIESQQVDFLQGAVGGRKVYSGKLPIPAHMHMYITDELFELRNQFVLEAIKEVGVPEELAEKILRVDEAFKKGLVKASVGQCEKRFFTDELLIIPKPSSYKKAS